MTQVIKKTIQNKMKKRNKEGGEAIGTALSTVFIMMLLMIPIGLFVFLMPRITLEQDVQQFASSIRLHGYVPSTVYDEFEENMMKRGYTSADLVINNTGDDWLQVYAIDVDTGDAYPNYVTLIHSDSNLPNPPVITRGNGKIVIKVKLPANSGIFAKSVNQMNPDNKSDEGEEKNNNLKDKVRYYNIGREIMSEAYSVPGGGS